MAAKHPAAFINTIHESGNKEEAIKYLQQTWDELCDAKEVLTEAKLQIEYLHSKYQPTGTSEAVLAKISAALSR